MQRLLDLKQKLDFLEKEFGRKPLSDKYIRKKVNKYIENIFKEYMDKDGYLLGEYLLSLKQSSDMFTKFPQYQISESCMHMQLSELRRRVNALGYIIIPIEYFKYDDDISSIVNNDIFKASKKLSTFNTYVITSLMNYDFWKEIVDRAKHPKLSQKRTKYFSEQYLSILLTIELIISAQVNLYRIISKQNEKLEQIREILDFNFDNISSVISRITDNQEKLNKKLDYLFNIAVDSEVSKMHNSYTRTERTAERYFAMRFVNPNDAQARLDHVRTKNSMYFDRLTITDRDLLEAVDDNSILNARQDRIHDDIGAYLASIQELRKKWKLEEIPELQLKKIHVEMNMLQQIQEETSNSQCIVIHTAANNIATDDGIVFFNNFNFKTVDVIE